MKRTLIIAQVLSLAVYGGRASGQSPIGTDFTYQGQLRGSGTAAITSADFEFALFNAESGGTQVGTTLSITDVGVVDGLFTIPLDFGPAAFNGEARWIQVAVRSPAGSGNYATLTPRQPIVAAPYALKTRGIDGHSLDAADGSPTDALFVDNSGRVGIGTTAPATVVSARLDVVGGHIAVSNNFGLLSRNAAGTGVGAGIDTTSTDDLAIVAAGSERVRVTAGGNLGVGTTAPVAGVHVKHEATPPGGTLALEGVSHTYLTFFPGGVAAGRRGYLGFASDNSPDITIATEHPAGRIVMKDSGGTHFPAGGQENLRVIRGFVVGDGTVNYGSGFTVNRIEEGRYLITFDTPFANLPVATANTVSVGFSSCFIEFSGIGNANIGLQVVRRSDGDLVDGHFYFIAIGPR